MRRHKMSRSHSKKNFRKGAKTSVQNVKPAPMRGGWRL